MKQLIEKTSLLIHLAKALAPNRPLKESIYTMKKLIVLIPALPAIAMFLTSCTTVVKEPSTATTTTTHEESVTRMPSRNSDDDHTHKRRLLIFAF